MKIRKKLTRGKYIHEHPYILKDEGVRQCKTQEINKQAQK